MIDKIPDLKFRRTAVKLTMLLSACFLSSCVTNKQIRFIQKSESPGEINIPKAPDLELLTGYRLLVSVSSSVPGKSDLFGEKDRSFKIDANGGIELPLAGYVKVAGLTVSEARKIIQEEISKFYTSPLVSVELAAINFSVLGEVRNAGKFTSGNNLNILQALAIAGDVNVTADRKAVTIIRDYGGSISRHNVDLTSETLFQSDFFYVLPNDIIYVEPMPVATFRRNGRVVDLIRDGSLILIGIVVAIGLL